LSNSGRGYGMGWDGQHYTPWDYSYQALKHVSLAKRTALLFCVTIFPSYSHLFRDHTRPSPNAVVLYCQARAFPRPKARHLPSSTRKGAKTPESASALAAYLNMTHPTQDLASHITYPLPYPHSSTKASLPHYWLCRQTYPPHRPPVSSH
jgi:hypothetical protein